MKKLSYSILSMAAAIVTTLSLASCGSDFSYSPGAEVSSDCPSIYFPSSNEASVSLEPSVIEANPDTVLTQTVKVARAKTTGAVTAQVIVDSKSDGVEIPSTVSFADGEAEADLVVSYSHPENGLSASFHLSDESVDPYTIKEGSISFSLSIAVIKKLCDVTYSSAQKRSETNKSLFANVKSEIYNYSGMNKFLWTNFCGSGIDVHFQVVLSSDAVFNASNLQTNKGEIEFLDHFWDYYEYGYVFLQSTASDFSDDTWPSWIPEGQEKTVSYLYVYDYAYSEYSGYYGVYDTIIFAPDDEWYNGYFANGLSVDGGTSWTRDGGGYIYFFFDYVE